MTRTCRSRLASFARSARGAALSCSLITLAALTSAANAENVVFAGTEGSSNSGYAYLGAIMPMEGSQLGRGWYRKGVISLIRYRYESTERGSTEEISGRVPGLEGGIGHVWKFDERTLDLSATAGYRHVGLRPFEPRDEKVGNVFTLNPQLMAFTPLGDRVDADLIANYAIGLGSSFARLRTGFRPASGWRVGVEAKRLEGRTYETRAAGVFVAKQLTEKLRLELTAGREKPRDDPSVSYGGVSFSTVF